MKRYSSLRHAGAACLFGCAAGLISGSIITLYKYFVKYAVHGAEWLYESFHRQPLWLILMVVALVVIAPVLAYIYRRLPDLKGGGIPTAISAIRGWQPFRWVSNAIGMFFLSLVAFFAGVPLGNEGPSVQLGTALGKGATALFGRRGQGWYSYGMTGGACAGFSTATGAPLSGILFAVEEAHQRVTPLILLVATTAVATARLAAEILSPLLGVSISLFPELSLRTLTVTEGWIPLLVGAAVGVFAVLFLSFYRFVVRLLNGKLAKTPHAAKLLGVLLLTLAAGLCSFSFVSTGHELIHTLFDGQVAIPLLLAVLVVRSTLTVGANASGMTGGTFLPILAIGTAVAALVASGAQSLLGLDPSYYEVILVLGLAACIAGMMKMPLTAIAFALEALSGAENVLPIVIAAAVAYGITELCAVESLSEQVLASKKESLHQDEGKIHA